MLRGNPGKRPLPEGEPQPAPGEPPRPDWLDDYAAEKWREVLPELLRVGLLTTIDGGILAAYCTAWSELRHATETLTAEGRTRTAEKNGYSYPHPAVSQQRTALKLVKDLGAQLGLSPSSRSALHIQPAGEDDPLAAFLETTRKHELGRSC
jgi:P27 family predicted phage terminase small subunit